MDRCINYEVMNKIRLILNTFPMYFKLVFDAKGVFSFCRRKYGFSVFFLSIIMRIEGGKKLFLNF